MTKPVPPPITCPTCEATNDWVRVVTGHYSADEWLHTNICFEWEVLSEEKEIETSMMESEPWECSNGHVASPEIAEKLEERRYNG